MAFGAILGKGQQAGPPSSAGASPVRATLSNQTASSAGNSSSQRESKEDLGSRRESKTQGEQPTGPTPVVREISREVLIKYMPGWDSKSHKHITFRSKDFELESLDGLVRLSGKVHEANKIDLTHLESFDVSENHLRDLSCLRGTQGFTSLRVLKARRNCLIYFEVNLPKLRELDLSHNCLKEIPPTSGMPQLEVCVLAHNEMNSTFSPLKNCKMLKKLDLSNNRFTCRPSDFAEQLLVLKSLPLLHTLRLKDNPFCRLLPEYQTFVLLQLPSLAKFDDMKNIEECKELSSTFDVKNLKEYDTLVCERGKADRMALGRQEQGHAKEIRLPNFQELMDPIQEALADSSKDNVAKGVKELIRICDTIHTARVEDIHNIFREQKSRTGGQSEAEVVDSAINQFLGDFVVLHSRIDEDKEQRVMLLRCLAKLAIVHCHEFGEKCMGRLGWLMKRSPEAEAEVLAVVQEIVVEPLRFKTIQDKQTMPPIRGLARFESPRLPEALAPIAGWLARTYCIMGVSPQQDVTRLLAVATMNLVNTERALSFHNTEGFGPAGGQGFTLPSHVILALENKTLSQNESLREQFMGHLQIVHNTAKYGGQRVVEVFEDKGLHRELVKMLSHFFGEIPPIDKDAPYDKANPKRNVVDIAHMKVLDIRTCAALLDAVTSLMDQSHDIMLDLADGKYSLGLPVVEFYSIAPRAPVSDPVLLAASLRGLHLILTKYSHENAKARKEMVNLIIKDLKNMEPMLEYMRGDKTQYQRLWQKAELHLSHKNEGGAGKASGAFASLQAPKLTALTNPLVHEAFEAIILVVKYFTADAEVSKACAQVSEAMDQVGRERLLFQLLQVPSQTVRSAVMSTLSKVKSAEMSTDEVGYLVELLNSAKDLSREESLLSQVTMQLQKFACERVNAGAALRADHANTSIDAVMSILFRNSKRVTFSASDEREKTELSQACVSYLKTVSQWSELRETNLRSKNINGSLIDVLKFEDELHSIGNPDICSENTWTGRSVETLLQCVSGRERLNARGKVAYRILCRIADVLAGRSDVARSDNSDQRTSAEMAKEECEMFDEAKLQREVKRLKGETFSVERGDRALQQQVFAAFNGLDRLANFLTDLYPSAEKKQEGRRSQQTTQARSMEFLEKAKTDAMQPSDLANGASAQGALRPLTQGGGQMMLHDAAPQDDDYTAFPIASYSGCNFPNRSGVIDLLADRDSLAFSGNFGNAVSITFKAEIDFPKPMSAMIDLGSGAPSDNIVVLADGLDLVMQIYPGDVASQFSECRVENALSTSDKQDMRQFLLVVTERGEMKIWVGEGDPRANKRNTFTPRYVRRSQYYVGSSDFPKHSPLYGTILDLKIWNGAMDWEEMLETLQNEQMDRRLVMSAMNRFDLQTQTPVKPHLQVGSSLGSSLPRDLQVREEFGDSEGRVNVAMPIAAMLRSCFALLKTPAAEHIRESMKSCLTDYLMVGQILALVRMCGPFDCYLAAKFLRLMSLALKLPADQSGQEADRVIIFDMLVSYYSSLCASTVRAVRQQDDAKLAARGLMTATEIARLASVIITSIPFCHNGLFADMRFQSAFFEQCYLRLMPIDVAESIMQMALDSSSGRETDAKTSRAGSDKDMDQINQMWELLRTLISTLLVKCPKMKYDIFMIFSTHIVAGTASLRQSFLSGVLEQIKQAEDKSKLQQCMGDTQAALPPPDSYCAIGAPVEGPERTIAFARCEVLVEDKWLGIADPGSTSPFLACVVTNKALRIIDASAGGYPEQPKVVKNRDLRDLTRLIRGAASQVIYVGLMTKTGEEEFMVIVCHREGDRHDMLSTLHSLSMPKGGGFSTKVPLQTDQVFKKAMDSIVSEPPIVSGFVKVEVDSIYSPDVLRFFVLCESQLYEIVTNFEYWLPAEQAEEAGSDSDREEQGIEDEMTKQQAESGGAKNKKTDEQEMLGDIFGGGGAGGHQARQLKMQIEEVKKMKERAMQKEKIPKLDPSGQPIASLDKSIEAIMKLAQPVRQMGSLDKAAFFPEGTPKISLSFEGGDKVTMVFFDDTQREHWKRTIVAQLNKDQAPGNKWVRNFQGNKA